MATSKRKQPRIVGWRIAQARWVSTAFTGKGAALDPGRWNRLGEPVIYTSENRALAAWEIYIHLKRTVTRYRFTVISATFSESMVETIGVEDYPSGWDSPRPHAKIQEFGSRWLQERRSCVLKVPSVVIGGQFNYLINPLHPDFKRVSIGEPLPFRFDRRLQNT